MLYLTLFLIALIGTASTAPLSRALSLRYNLVAKPGGRRQHHGHIPKLGGLSLAFGYFFAIGLIYILLPPAPQDTIPLRGVILGSLLVFIGGLLDDRYDFSALPQFAIQFIAALVANAHVAFLERVANPFPHLHTLDWVGLLHYDPTLDQLIFSKPIAWLITTFWIMGMMNAVNWLDGLDGLAVGVGAIACLIFAWHGFNLGQTSVAAFPLALAGALVGLLLFNFAPARIFLGSAGAYLLSYNLATLSFLAPAKLATVLLVLALPLLDGVWRVIDRLRQGRNPMSGDRGHLHFLLADRGWPVRAIVLGYYAVALFLGLLAIYLPSGGVKLIVLTVVALTILLGLILLTRRPRL